MVKSVTVCQNSICVWGTKIKQFCLVCNDLTMIKMFCNPCLEKRIFQNCSRILWEFEFTKWIGTETRGNQKQHSANEKKTRTRYDIAENS